MTSDVKYSREQYKAKNVDDAFKSNLQVYDETYEEDESVEYAVSKNATIRIVSRDVEQLPSVIENENDDEE